MRKSTVVLIVIVVAAGVALTLLLDSYLDMAQLELQNGSALTRAHAADLAPGTRVKLRRTPGGADYPVKSPERPGLLVEAQPSIERWSKDVSGYGLARELSEHAIRLYAPDHRITWLRLKMRRPDDSLVVHAFEPGDGGDLVAIPSGDASPAARTPPAPAPVPAAGTAPSPGSPPGPDRPR